MLAIEVSRLEAAAPKGLYLTLTVIIMKDNYELKNPRKNPYAERMKNGYTIIIDRVPDSDKSLTEKGTKPAETQQQSTISHILQKTQHL